MGKPGSYEMIQYREQITRELCASPVIAKLLGCESDGNPEETIPFQYSFPYEYIPGSQTGPKRFINYEISTATNSKNSTFKDLTVTFYIVCHESAIWYEENGRTCLWYDRAACELETIFCGKNVLGIGRAAPVSNVPYAPQTEWKGRQLKFTVKDYING